MSEVGYLARIRINLIDYDVQKDIENRILMSSFSELDVSVLQEILFRSIKIEISKLAEDLKISKDNLLNVLKKLEATNLFKIDGSNILVDKETRRYYEGEIAKFENGFKCDMDFLQKLLKKVPIHILPSWYAIPRSSNDIFSSIVEKYLLTPQVFQRHLMELSLENDLLANIIKDVYESKDLRVSSGYIIEKYSLSREEFERNMIHLEFAFACCVRYEKDGSNFKEIITPFHEWEEYTSLLKNIEPMPLTDSRLSKTELDEFSFIQDLESTLIFAKKKNGIQLSFTKQHEPVPEKSFIAFVEKHCLAKRDLTSDQYSQYLLSKLCTFRWGKISENKFNVTHASEDWLKMCLTDKALFIYRHHVQHFVSNKLPSYLCTDCNIREAEKSISRVINKGWVYFDNFLKSLTISFNEKSKIHLKRCGKSWHYVVPEYTKDEIELVRATIFEWLHEVGVVFTNVLDGKECFCITSFGKSLFGG